MSIVTDERVLVPQAGSRPQLPKRPVPHERAPRPPQDGRPHPQQRAAGVRWGEQQRELEARRAAAVVSPRRVTTSYTEPERVDLRTAEDRPLSAVQAQQVARLVEEHGDHLVRYVRLWLADRRAAYWVEAEDIAQEVWLAVARGRVPQLLDQSQPWPLLAGLAKMRIREACSVRRRREWLVRVRESDGRTADQVLESLAPCEDTTARAVLEELEPSAGGVPACYAERIAQLPPKQREVLELRCVDGMTMPAIAARVGHSRQYVEELLERAVVALGGACRAARPRSSGQPLPDGWEKVIGRLPSRTQRDVVRLRAAGASFYGIGMQLGLSRSYVRSCYIRAVGSLREMVADHRMDPEPALEAAFARLAPGAEGRCAA